MDKNTGFAWHVRHDTLVEWCYSEEERRKYIRQNKPVNEQALRLRLLQPVRGALPLTFVQARTKKSQAWGDCVRAWNGVLAWDDAQARTAYALTCNAYYQARAVYVLALATHQEEIEALHRQECVNCPWDGHTIFPPPPMEASEVWYAQGKDTIDGICNDPSCKYFGEKHEGDHEEEEE